LHLGCHCCPYTKNAEELAGATAQTLWLLTATLWTPLDFFSKNVLSNAMALLEISRPMSHENNPELASKHIA
jgi:hypothetical protein